MKFRICAWAGLLFLLLTTRPGQAQDFAGQWQGVEFNPRAESSEVWPSQLTLRAGAKGLSGTLYQLALSAPDYTVTYQMRGVRADGGLRLAHTAILAETKPDDDNSDWCLGTMVFAYDAAQEKLTGHSAYPTPGCRNGTLELYRVRLKSAGTVPAGQLSTLRVSGRNVRWFADADLRRPLASGNTHRTRLSKTTTFYITQGFYPTSESLVVPITVRVGPAAKAAPTPRPAAPIAPLSLPPTPPVRADSLARPPVAAALPTVPAAPVVLPTVLFQRGTPVLLPTASPALDQLAADLQANPALRLRVAGHTDHIGETEKNQALSEQRAAAVKAYLVKAGVAASRIETQGYGDSRPLYPSPDLRNRRVEVEEIK